MTYLKVRTLKDKTHILENPQLKKGFLTGREVRKNGDWIHDDRDNLHVIQCSTIKWVVPMKMDLHYGELKDDGDLESINHYSYGVYLKERTK